MVRAINGAIQFLIAAELANDELEAALVALVQFSIGGYAPVPQEIVLSSPLFVLNFSTTPTPDDQARHRTSTASRILTVKILWLGVLAIDTEMAGEIDLPSRKFLRLLRRDGWPDRGYFSERPGYPSQTFIYFCSHSVQAYVL
jgi:hypothetical protein